MKILWILLLLKVGAAGSVHPADSAQAADTLHYLLPEVTVQAQRERQIDRISSLPVVEISRSYLLKNNATNFVQTLASVPGIASMDIGAGFSKPVIRGLGFNRVAVVDRGIVQQNQQWGADHGLEIDLYDVDNVRVGA